jgi:hypothetical protein
VSGSLEEYLPLLAVEAGVERHVVPLVGLMVYAAMAAGGVLAGRASRLPGRALGVVLLGAAVALALGALARVPADLVLVAVAFCGFQAVTVVAGARLQDAIDPGARARP